MTDKEKCVLKIDWQAAWEKYYDITSYRIRGSKINQHLADAIEQEINKAAQRLIEEHDNDKYRYIRMSYKADRNKINAIKAIRTIDKTLSLKEAKDIVESW